MYLQLLYILDGLSPLVVRTSSLYLSDSFQPEVTLSAIRLPCKRILVSVHFLGFFLISDFQPVGVSQWGACLRDSRSLHLAFESSQSMCLYWWAEASYMLCYYIERFTNFCNFLIVFLVGWIIVFFMFSSISTKDLLPYCVRLMDFPPSFPLFHYSPPEIYSMSSSHNEDCLAQSSLYKIPFS